MVTSRNITKRYTSDCWRWSYVQIQIGHQGGVSGTYPDVSSVHTQSLVVVELLVAPSHSLVTRQASHRVSVTLW